MGEILPIPGIMALAKGVKIKKSRLAILISDSKDRFLRLCLLENFFLKSPKFPQSTKEEEEKNPTRDII